MSLPKMICEREIVELERELDQLRDGKLRVTLSDEKRSAWSDETEFWLNRTRERLEAIRTVHTLLSDPIY